MSQITKHETETLLISNVSNFKTYHEMLETSVVEVSEVDRLKMNIKQLEDLHGRLQFAMTEIRSLMKKI